MTHTRGPWMLLPDGHVVSKPLYNRPRDDGESIVVQVAGLGGSDSKLRGMALADARLIAAAPEMLDAAKDAIQTCLNAENQCDLCASPAPAHDRTCALYALGLAVAKAEGRDEQ